VDIGPPEPARIRRHLSIVVVGFFGLRAALWATGLRFEDHLKGQLQLLDEKVLTANPFVAFTQLNIQPPLWNFYVGAVRAWSPLPAAATFQIVWVAADLATVLMLWDLLVRLGARRWQATVATVLVASNPLLVSSESFLRYETAVTFLVTASVFAFARFVEVPSARRCALFCGVLFLGVSTRALLHPLWLVGGVTFAFVIARRAGAFSLRLLAPAAFVIVLVAGNLVYLHVRFGNSSYSSYFGMNLERIAVTTLPQDTLDRLQADGTLSDLADVKPYVYYEDYAARRPALARCRPGTTDPALALPRKSSGEANLNYVCYLGVYRVALDDSFAAIRAEPGNYARSVAQSAVIFASWPAPFDQPSADSFDWLEKAYKPFLLPVHVQYDVGGSDPQRITAYMVGGLERLPVLLTVVGALVLALWRGVASGWRLLRDRTAPGDEIRAWLAITVAFVALAGIAFDFYENARFRQALDPIILGPLFVWMLAIAERIVRRLRSRVAATSSAHEARVSGSPASTSRSRH